MKTRTRSFLTTKRPTPVSHKKKHPVNFYAIKDLKLGEMYYLVSGATNWLFQTKEEAIKHTSSHSRIPILGPQRSFLVVDLVRLPKQDICGIREWAVKVMAGEDMGWIIAQEIKLRFKKLEPGHEDEFLNHAEQAEPSYTVSPTHSRSTCAYPGEDQFVNSRKPRKNISELNLKGIYRDTELTSLSRFWRTIDQASGKRVFRAEDFTPIGLSWM